MANDIQVIKTEIDTDPLLRNYAAMTNQQVADDMNSFYRPGIAAPGALFNYLIKETARDDSSETPTNIYGRLARIVAAGRDTLGPPGEEVFAQTYTPGPFRNLTPVSLDACVCLLAIADQDRLGTLRQDMNETQFDALLENVRLAGVYKPADVTAIKALSDNRQSRGQELDLSNRVREGEVERARAL